MTIRRIEVIVSKLFLCVLGVFGMMVVCWLLSAILHALIPWGTAGPPAW